MAPAQSLLDYSQVGKKYAMLGQTVRTLPSGGVKDKGLEYYGRFLQKAALMQQAGEHSAELVGEIIGCSNHFETYLHQMTNFMSHLDAIENLAKGGNHPDYPVFIYTEEDNKEKLQPPIAIGLSSSKIEYDFILLLLSSVALLERLSTLLYARIMQRSDRNCNFYNLRADLAASADSRGQKILAAINLVSSNIDGVLVTVAGGDKSLRNRLAHLLSMPEMTRSVLTIHLLNEQNYLVFDQDLADFPVFGTVHKIANAVPFIVIASMSTMLSHDSTGAEIAGTEFLRNLDKADFMPDWQNPAIDKNQFIPQGGNTVRVSFFRQGLNENTIDTLDISDEIFNHSRAL